MHPPGFHQSVVFRLSLSYTGPVTQPRQCVWDKGGTESAWWWKIATTSCWGQLTCSCRHTYMEHGQNELLWFCHNRYQPRFLLFLLLLHKVVCLAADPSADSALLVSRPWNGRSPNYILLTRLSVRHLVNWTPGTDFCVSDSRPSAHLHR